MSLVGPLSPRQLEILARVADGHPDATIAAALGLTVGTVRRHFFDAQTKLGAHNRAHAVALGYRTGQLTLDTRETR